MGIEAERGIERTTAHTTHPQTDKEVMEHQQLAQLIHNNRINYGASLAWENSQTLQQTTQKSENGYSSVRSRKLRAHACLEGIKSVNKGDHIY